MADISAKDVMVLRNNTGLPMMACKKALIESDGDVAAAEELLRIQLKGKMDTRTDRVAGEGRIAIAIGDGCGAIVEVRSETDFTAKNDQFVALADKVAQLALAGEPGTVSATDEITAAVDELRISTSENCSFARGLKLAGEKFGSYVHHDGKTGVLIQAEGDISDDTLRDLCMHITAAMPVPLGVGADDIPAEAVEKEKHFRTQQAIESGKPPQIAEKIVEGGMRKFFAEVSLLAQPFVRDPDKTIKDIVGDATIVAFHRWQVGESA